MQIVFVIDFPFPYGVAYSSRARHLVKLWTMLGHKVHVISYATRDNQDEVETSGYSQQVVVPGASGMKMAMGIGITKPFTSVLETYLEHNNVDVIISSNMSYICRGIYKVAKKHGIPYVKEMCEWYDKASFRWGAFNPHYLEHSRMHRYWNKRLDGIIAISSFLENHYRQMGLKVIRIPTIVDKSMIESRDTEASEPISIAFAGVLDGGKKEEFKPILQALDIVNAGDGKRIELDLYGPTEEQLLLNIDGDTDLFKRTRRFVNLHGRIPQAAVEEAIRRADYTILIRPDRRSSHAGFPTKLVESLAVGTPVIANATGDIAEYLKNEENGFIAEDDSAEAITRCFQKVLEIGNDDYRKIRLNARADAEQSFDYRVYIDDMASFLNGVQETRGVRE